MLQEMSVASSPPLDLDQDSLELFTEEKEGHVAEFTKVQWLIAFISVLTVEDPDPNPLPVLWIQILWIWIRIHFISILREEKNLNNFIKIIFILYLFF